MGLNCLSTILNYNLHHYYSNDSSKIPSGRTEENMENVNK